MNRRMRGALLSVLALVLGTGALTLSTAGTARADLAPAVTLSPTSGDITDAQPFSQVSVSAPCPEGYQDALDVNIAIPDFGDSAIAFGVTDGAPYSGSTITANIPPASDSGPPWVNTIQTAFENYGAEPADGTYTIKVVCATVDQSTADTATFSTLIDITGTHWEVKQAPPATSTSVALSSNVTGHTTVSHDFTLTAAVTPTDAAGSVQFLSGVTPLGAPVDVSGGSASTTVPGIARPGQNAYSAVFTPADPTAFTSSTSTALTVAVVDEPDLTALDDSGNTLDDTPALTAGQKVKLTLQGFMALTPPSGADAGTGEPVTVALDGAAGSLAKATTDGQGTVTNYAFTVPSDAADGSHTLTFTGDTTGIAQPFAFTVGAAGSTAGSTAGDTSGSSAGATAGDTSGSTAGSTAGDTSGSTAGDTSGATAGDTSGTTGGTTGTSGDASAAGGTSGSGGSSGGGTGPLAATGADGVVPLSALALLLLAGGGYAVHRVRRDGKLLTFGPGPRD